MALAEQQIIDIIELEAMNLLTAIEESIKTELEGQGHRASGSLIDDIKKETQKTKDAVIGAILINDYYKYVDTGFSPKLGKKYIDALIEWMQRPSISIGSSDKERKSIAFAIYATAKKTGHPTPGSYQYASNGRRKDFVAQAIDPIAKRADKYLNLGNLTSVFINGIIANVQRN